MYIVQGDHGIPIPFKVQKLSASENIEGATVEVTIHRGEDTFTKAATIIDAAKGECEFVLTSSDLTIFAKYEWQWTAYLADGRIFSGKKREFFVSERLMVGSAGGETVPVIVPFARVEELEALEGDLAELQAYVDGLVISGGGSVVQDSLLNGNLKVNNAEVTVYDESAIIERIEALELTGTGGTVPSNVILFEDWVGGESVTIDTGTTPPSDTTAPVLTITAGGTFTGTKSVTMSVNETADIYYTLDGSTPATSSTKYTSPLSISATTTLKAFAKDTAGNSSAVQTITYTLDATPPADSTAPDNVTNLAYSNLAQTSLTLTWTASASSDVASYDVYNGSTLLANVTGTTYAVSGLSASTQYTFTVKAKDAANNVASGASVTTTTSAPTDTTAPVLTITPAATFTDTKTVTMTTNETATIYYTLDDTDPKTSGTKLTYTAPLTLTATDTIKAYAVDTANNEGAVQTVTYTKQNVSQAMVTVDGSGYLVMPSDQLVWGAMTGMADANFISVYASPALGALFDQTVSPPIKFEGLPFVTYSSTFTNNYFECIAIGTGSYAGKIVIKLSTAKGATAAEIISYIANKLLSIKLAASYKTYAISSNISTVTTRTSGVDTTQFEYFKCTLNDGIGTYVPPTVSDTSFISNGYDVTPTGSFVYSRTYLNMRINADSTLEMLLPKGTLTTIDVAGVSAYLASANLKVYYA